MQDCPSYEANSSLTGQVLAFYGTSTLTTMFITTLHLSPSWARWTQSMFSHMTSFKNHFNIILLSTPRSFTLPYQNCVCISILFGTIHTLHSSHPHLFETWIKFGKNCKSWRSSLCDFFPSSSSLGLNILLSTLFWNTHRLYVRRGLWPITNSSILNLDLLVNLQWIHHLVPDITDCTVHVFTQ